MSNELNRQKVENFFRTEYNKLISFVRKNIEERFFGSTPEDIVQDVALNILSKLDIDLQFENLAGYIYRSLKNRSIDAGRQKNIPISTNTIVNEEFGPAELAEDEPEFDNLDELNITEEQLHDAILKLKPNDRDIIILTEFEDFTFAELSEEWNVPIGTLLSRKHRALAKLHKLLKQTEITKTIKIKENGSKRKVFSKM
jgi:RNA polymerase sigma factor (sigma-70 family)